MAADDLAQQLLDAQVAHHLSRLGDDQVAATLASLADSILDAAGDHQVADLVDAGALKAVVAHGLASLPPSSGVAALVDMVTEVVSAGPAQGVCLADVVERAQVEALLDAVLDLTPVAERALDRLTNSPLVGAAASRFMGRIAAEVLATNQAIADKIPGLGSLTRLGTSAASRVVGVADKQLEGLMSATVGKGSAFAVRRLNGILLDTARDPATRAAALQVWDLVAAEPLVGLGRHLSEEQIAGLTAAGHDLAVTALGHDAAAHLAGALVDALLEWFGGYTAVELLDQFDLDRARLVADLQRLAPPVVAALRDSGQLEAILRRQLEPFYASSEVAAILDADSTKQTKRK